MRIKSIVFYLKEIKYMKNILRTYGDSMVKGKYHQYNCFRALSLADSNVMEKAGRHFHKRVVIDKRRAQIARVLNKTGFFCNKNKRSTEEYDAIYIANNFDEKREVKLFSFKNNRVLTICTSAEKAERQMEEYNSFSFAYDMPKVKKSDRYDNAIEISMVELNAYCDELEALESIVKSVVKFNPSAKPLKSMSVGVITELDSDAEIDECMQQIADKIDPQMKDMRIPVCIQHGDLSKDNLIHGESDGKTTFWWIDWEHACERLFFYDYFFYILNSALYDDMKPFDAYMSDKADGLLDSYFKHFGLDFKEQSKFDYFLIFSLVFLKERVCTKSGLPVVQRYCDLIAKMERRSKEKKTDEARIS